MGTKEQHFVPRVYLKEWETEIITNGDPIITGLYVFKDGQTVGKQANKKSILWKPHVYSISFDYLYIAKSCPIIYTDFVNMVFTIMHTERRKPIYGKLGYHIIKNKRTIRAYLQDIEKWDFYYEGGNQASKKRIINQVSNLYSYVLEKALDDNFEKFWKKDLDRFIEEVHRGIPVGTGKSERIISEEIAIKILNHYFAMVCRSPYFNAMGIYEKLKTKILYPIFEKLFSLDSDISKEFEQIKKDSHNYVDDLMKGIWYSEIYRIIFKDKGGFYHNIMKKVIDGCQMILFEAYPDAGTFITSDNPAFEHISHVEYTSGLYFSLTPKYLLFIGKGEDKINIVEHRFADSETIKVLNRIIYKHKKEKVIASDKFLTNIL